MADWPMGESSKIINKQLLLNVTGYTLKESRAVCFWFVARSQLHPMAEFLPGNQLRS